MQYDAIILELLDRIKQLEGVCTSLESRITYLEEQQPDELFEEATPSASRDEVQESVSPARQKMTQAMMDACYACGRQLFEDSTLPFNKAMAQLTAQTGMNHGSAVIYVYAVLNMLKGEAYKRSISKPATELYLQYMLGDFGKKGLAKALAALNGHITYREQCGHVVNGLIAVCKRYEALL